jgi:hypothetical protein
MTNSMARPAYIAGAVSVALASVLWFFIVARVFWEPCDSDCGAYGIMWLLLLMVVGSGLLSYLVGKSLQEGLPQIGIRRVMLVCCVLFLVSSVALLWIFSILLIPLCWVVWKRVLEPDSRIRPDGWITRGRFVLMIPITFCAVVPIIGVVAHRVPYSNMVYQTALLALLGLPFLTSFLGLSELRKSDPPAERSGETTAMG